MPASERNVEMARCGCLALLVTRKLPNIFQNRITFAKVLIIYITQYPLYTDTSKILSMWKLQYCSNNKYYSTNKCDCQISNVISKTMHQIQQRDHTAVKKTAGIGVIHNIAVSNSAQIPLKYYNQRVAQITMQKNIAPPRGH